jgi:hypothetical protein
MASKRKNRQEVSPRIVEQGANWRIEQIPGDRDYWAYVEERGFIGARPTATAARMLIAEYNVPEAS